MFKAVDVKEDFPKMEEKILEFWKKNRIFQKSLRRGTGGKEFSFYDGPPFATGKPHFGHLVPGTIKDAIPRYKTMKGYKVERRWGWDCHGLPVENEMKKKLSISSAKQIQEYGVSEYNENCRSIVMRFTEDWERIITRSGRWVDFKHGYRTMDLSYMESVWWVFKTLYKKGLIYKGYNILPYSPGLGCPLSNMEVNLGGYKNVTDPAITVKFKVIGEDNTFFLAWTTTPWTLPSNLALTVGPDIRYVKIRDRESGCNLILGKERLDSYYKDPSEYEITGEFNGTDLKGMRYEPLFPYFSKLADQGAFTVVCGDFVTTQDGCGIVHTAPGFGEDDYKVLKGTGIPVVCPVDDECKFTDEVPDYKGMFVKDADKLIIQRLKEEWKLVKRENYLHSYPFCWRTGTPLIYRAMDCWFVKVSAMRDLLLASNQQITWVPEHLKSGRFGKWLEGARDWAISRNRFWGNPIPVWVSDSSDYVEVIGSVRELEKKSGRKIADLHKHFIDDITWPAPDGKGTMHRVPDVLDCWFESGSMPYGQLHYPFRNKDKFNKHFPADFVSEGLDQTRGWFYTLTVLATALFEKPAFLNCVTNGIILAEDGEKMSKSKNNFTDPEDVINQYGADALRFALMSSSAVHADDVKYSDSLVKDVLKTLILPLWNSYSFFVTYANLDHFNPSGKMLSHDDFEKLDNPMDIWIISVLEKLTNDVTQSFEKYDIQSVCGFLTSFIDSLNNWYIRRNRRRFWKSENDSDKETAYSVLYTILMTYVKLACPVIPFITEEIYRNLRTSSDPVSVHLCDYPEYDVSIRNPELERKMALTVKAVTMGRALRSAGNIKNRQPLKKVFIVDSQEEDRIILTGMKDIILEELNVKGVEIQSNERDLVDYSAKANFKVLGNKLGKDMKEVASLIQNMKSDEIFALLNGESFLIRYGDDKQILLKSEDVVVQRNEKSNLKILNDGELTVGFDTEITEDLINEGIARDLIRSIQTMRKEKGLDVSDRIITFIKGHSNICNAVKQFKDYISNETLSLELEYETDDSLQDEFSAEIKKK